MLRSLKDAAFLRHSAAFLRHSAAFLRRESPISYLRRPSRESSFTRMSYTDSKSSLNQIIEHIVLFRVKPDADPSYVAAMADKLNGLISLDSVLHISAGRISRCRSSSLTFTHMLHARYRSKTDLNSYADHPNHVGVVSNYVRPIVDDAMAIDWVAEEFSDPVVLPPGSSLRLTVLKLKEGVGENEKSEVFGILKGIREEFPSIEQLTVGENFSPGRNKGFSLCSIAVAKEIKELGSDSEVGIEGMEKVKDSVDEHLVLDYTVEASIQAANA